MNELRNHQARGRQLSVWIHQASSSPLLSRKHAPTYLLGTYLS